MKKIDFKVVLASIDDLPELMSLWKEQYDFHYGLDPTYYVPFTEELGDRVRLDLAKQLEGSEPHILVAKNKNLIGFVTFGTDTDDYYDANIKEYGVIKEILVTRKFRAQGVGAALIAEVERYFKSNGVRNVMIQCSSFNGNALAVYNKLGYKTRQELLYKAI